jgi:hypothetical protein
MGGTRNDLGDLVGTFEGGGNPIVRIDCRQEDGVVKVEDYRYPACYQLLE